MKRRERLLRWILGLALLCLLVACGGRSGSGSSGTPPPPSSNWDSMIWDQDKWG